MARFTGPAGGAGVPGPQGPAGPAGSDANIPQPLDTTDTPTFDKIYVAHNSDGTNIKIGDDAWIGDVDEGNQFAVIGVENSALGGIIFGDALANKIYTDGSGLVLEANNGDMNFWMDGGMYIGASDGNNQIMKRSDLNAVDAKTLPTGGTTGQVLSKVDGTDYNVTWANAGSSSTSTVKHEVKLGVAVNKGQAVYVSSADGTNMIVSKASNDAESTSSKTMGLIETTGVLNDHVNVITEGLLAGLDTSNATAGDPVWLGTGGNLIYGLSNKPVAPAHLVFIGIVTRSQSVNGEIFVKVQNGFELNELHDVLIGSGYSSTPADNDLLAYDTASGLWKNQTAAQASLASLTGTETLTNKTLTTPTIATINGGSTSATPSLFPDVTTGTIGLGLGVTTGTINIGTAANSTGTKTINIGSGTATGGITNVNLGSATASSSAITVNGTTYLKGTTFIRSLENDSGNVSSIALFNNMASGNVSLASGTSFTGQLNLATGSTNSNKTINIGTGSTAGTTTITLGSTSGAANSIVLNGPVTVSGSINAGVITGTSFGPSGNSTAGYLFDSTTIGLTYWGRYITTGTVEIANGTSFSGTLNIGSGGTSSGTKSINIGSGGQAGSTTNVVIGTGTGATSNTYLQGKVIMATPTVPGSATATGIAGQMAWDANYIYVCTATNTWKRSAISTW